MSDLFKTAVQKTVKNMIGESYPHILHPSCVYAEITEVKSEGEVRVAVLKILDKKKRINEQFPEIPGVRTYLDIKKKDLVAVVMLYGESVPYIIGRCA